LPEMQKKREADVDFLAVWAHVCNQEHQVIPRGASDRRRESVRKSVSVHQDKIRGSAIVAGVGFGGGQRERDGDSDASCCEKCPLSSHLLALSGCNLPLRIGCAVVSFCVFLVLLGSAVVLRNTAD